MNNVVTINVTNNISMNNISMNNANITNSNVNNMNKQIKIYDINKLNQERIIKTEIYSNLVNQYIRTNSEEDFKEIEDLKNKVSKFI